MSTKYPAGVITAVNPVTPSGPYQSSTASGIWTMEQAGYWIKKGQWPTAGATASLWSWGRNNFGQLGLGNITNYSSPKQVGSLTTWSNSTVGFMESNSARAIKSNGTLWSWGYNGVGELGLGNTTYYSSPKQVGSLTNWLSVSCGAYFTFATKTDGTLWSWGYNNYGQLGLGNITNYSSPKQVGSLTTWLKITAGPYYAIATKTDGTLWSWGRNNYGQLGLGNVTNYSSPKQVGSLTNWAGASIAASATSLVIKSDGTFWAWGAYNAGQLPLNVIAAYSSPKQVGVLTNWLTVTAGLYHAGAVKSNGTAWVWGQGTNGALGLNNSTSYSSPVQLGALTTWSKLSAGRLHTAATKTNKSLWSWGSNVYGQLGLGSTTNYSSPKQVGSLNVWATVSSGNYHTIATTQ